MDDSYCETPAPAPVKPTPVKPVPGEPVAVEAGPPYAECVLCRKPTEYAESVKGSTLCPVCAWQEAGRTSCSG